MVENIEEYNDRRYGFTPYAAVCHIHGACADFWFSHIVVEVPGENCSNEWLEPVSDEQYDSLGK